MNSATLLPWSTIPCNETILARGGVRPHLSPDKPVQVSGAKPESTQVNTVDRPALSSRNTSVVACATALLVVAALIATQNKPTQSNVIRSLYDGDASAEVAKTALVTGSLNPSASLPAATVTAPKTAAVESTDSATRPTNPPSLRASPAKTALSVGETKHDARRTATPPLAAVTSATRTAPARPSSQAPAITPLAAAVSDRVPPPRAPSEQHGAISAAPIETGLRARRVEPTSPEWADTGRTSSILIIK